MSPLVYLFLFTVIFFSINLLLQINVEGNRLFSELVVNGNSKINSFISIENKNQEQLLSSTNLIAHGNTKKEKIGADIEIDLKLRKYNRRLSRNLKTLSYISVMEVSTQFKNDTHRLADILNLKRTIQYDIIKITKQINYYKSLINK